MGNRENVLQVLRSESNETSMKNLKNITEEKDLKEIAECCKYPGVALKAVERIKDEKTLKKIVSWGLADHNKLPALNRINDQKYLYKLVKGVTSDSVKMTALKRITDPCMLKKIMKRAMLDARFINAAAVQLSSSGTNAGDIVKTKSTNDAMTGLLVVLGFSVLMFGASVLTIGEKAFIIFMLFGIGGVGISIKLLFTVLKIKKSGIKYFDEYFEFKENGKKFYKIPYNSIVLNIGDPSTISGKMKVIPDVSVTAKNIEENKDFDFIKTFRTYSPFALLLEINNHVAIFPNTVFILAYQSTIEIDNSLMSNVEYTTEYSWTSGFSPNKGEYSLNSQSGENIKVAYDLSGDECVLKVLSPENKISIVSLQRIVSDYGDLRPNEVYGAIASGVKVDENTKFPLDLSQCIIIEAKNIVCVIAKTDSLISASINM